MSVDGRRIAHGSPAIFYDYRTGTVRDLLECFYGQEGEGNSLPEIHWDSLILEPNQ